MTKDTRDTLPAGGSFLPLLEELYTRQEQVAVLYEKDGITRGNGLITGLYQENGLHWMVLNGNQPVQIDTVVAVNGLFSPDYSEC